MEEREIRKFSEDYPDWRISRLSGPARWWKATRRGRRPLSEEEHRRGVARTLIEDTAEHGGGGLARVRVTHGAGRVGGVLVQRALPEAGSVPEVSFPVLLEIERLLEASTERVTDVADLAESGRGLAVVAALCPGRLEFEPRADHSVIRWELEGCSCTGGEPVNPGAGEAGI